MVSGVLKSSCGMPSAIAVAGSVTRDARVRDARVRAGRVSEDIRLNNFMGDAEREGRAPFQTKRMMKAITSAYGATASVSANPRMARPNTRSRAAGLRATLVTNDPKICPMPTPTPARAITASPAPIILAELRSIVRFPFDHPVARAGEAARLFRYVCVGSVQANLVVPI